MSSLAQRQAQALKGAHPRDAVRQAQRAWLERVMAETGKSLSAIAGLAQVSDTTLTRFYNDKNNAGALSGAVVQAVSDATGVVGPGAIVTRPSPSSLLEDGVRYDAGENTLSVVARAVNARLGEDPNLSAWLMTSDVLRLAGVLCGDILIIDQGEDPRDGDVVCAQIEHGIGAKTVFRVFQRPALVGAAVDMASVRPEIVDGQRVRVAGVMTGLLRHRV